MSELGVVEVAASPVERFREYLAMTGKRLTPERNTVVEEVFASHDHFDADQLVHRLSQPTDGRRVSRATIYRTLVELVKAGLLRTVARANDREVYEHDYGYPQHDHLICKKCGKLIEFTNTRISPILDEVAADHGFRISGHRLEVYGMCADCSRPPRMGHRKLDMI